MALLEATGIKKRFGGVHALVDANLTCHAGRITGLLGANGSGKSTISKIITGVYRADDGCISYIDKNVVYKNPFDAKKAGISMVFQNLSLILDMTVWQNIVLGFEQKKGLFLNNESARQVSKDILEKLYPSLDIEKKVSELTPGEMQIVEIAKAISEKPCVLILDEPTAALEQEQVRSLFSYMRELASQGVGIVFTSHRIWEILEICDDIYVFRNGANVGYKDFSVEAPTAAEIVSLITGSIVSGATHKQSAANLGETVLSIKNMNLGNKLKNINVELKKGEILGIGGLAGQGQQELMLALAGNYRFVTGQFEVAGKSVSLKKPVNAVRNDILLVPGDRQLEGLFADHSIYRNLIYPKMNLKRQPLFTPNRKYRKEAAEIVKKLSIKIHSLDEPVSTLSGGNQQKVVVGKWLSFDMNVLLLADPAKGVDVGAKKDLYAFIRQLVDEKKISVILYASDNEELIENCDRLCIMYEGQIVATLAGDDINEETIIESSMRV